MMGVAPDTATGPQLVMRSNWESPLHLHGQELSSTSTTPSSSKHPPLGLPPSPPSEAACWSSQTMVRHARYDY